MTRQPSNVAWWIVSAVCVYLSWKLVAPLVPTLALAFGLAIAVRPLHRRLERRLASPGAAAFLVIVILLVAIIAPGALLLTRIANESLAAANWIRAAAQAGDLDRYMTYLPAMDLDAGIRQFSGYFASGISAAIANSVWIVAEVLMALFALFFLLRDRARILDSIRALLPLPADELTLIFDRVGDTIYASLYGNLAVKAVQGFLGGAMFAVLGLPAPAFWGTAMAVLAAVPFVGTGIVWAPAALYLLWQGSWIKAIVLAVWGAGIVSTIDNFLYPILVGRELRLHTLAVFIAFIGGLSAFGAAGAVLGPAILAVAATLIDIRRRRSLAVGPQNAAEAAGDPDEVP